MTDDNLPPPAVMRWRPIQEAPKGRKVIVGYRNSLGKWRSVMATFFPAGALELADDYLGNDGDDGDGFAPAGWYENTETHEVTLPTEGEPTHFMPLPEPPQ